MSTVISRGPLPASAQLHAVAETAQSSTPNTSLSDGFDGVITGEALQASLASGHSAQALNLNAQAQTHLQAAVAAVNANQLSDAASSVASATQAQGITTYNDVNALVQQVLREAYLQNTEDLRMFAEKVKFFNNVKETLRNELTRARESLTSAIEANPGVSGDEHMSLREPFLPGNVDTTFRGGTDVSMADALTRLPGISAVRTGGQAAQINIRGLSGDFVFSTLNGREQVSTSGSRAIEFGY